MSENEFYNEYTRWKNWAGNPNVSLVSERYEKEMRRAGVKSGSTILEVGFGDGAFLDWARGKGFNVFGAEITQPCVDNARKRDHQVTIGTIDEAMKTFDRKFDAIVAFDVLEHIEKPGLVQVLTEAHSALVEGGVLVASFPNGASPFGRYYQNGDITHETALTDRMLGQLGLKTGFLVEGAYNAARPIFGRRPYLAPIKMGLAAFRAFVEIIISYVYFGSRIPLDPVMTVVLRKVV